MYVCKLERERGARFLACAIVILYDAMNHMEIKMESRTSCLMPCRNAIANYRMKAAQTEDRALRYVHIYVTLFVEMHFA